MGDKDISQGGLAWASRSGLGNRGGGWKEGVTGRLGDSCSNVGGRWQMCRPGVLERSPGEDKCFEKH